MRKARWIILGVIAVMMVSVSAAQQTVSFTKTSLRHMVVGGKLYQREFTYLVSSKQTTSLSAMGRFCSTHTPGYTHFIEDPDQELVSAGRKRRERQSPRSTDHDRRLDGDGEVVPDAYDTSDNFISVNFTGKGPYWASRIEVTEANFKLMQTWKESTPTGKGGEQLVGPDTVPTPPPPQKKRTTSGKSGK